MRRHTASRKDLLDGARDTLGFNTGPADPVNPEGVPANFHAINKERKFINNLGWNMLVLPRQF